MKLTFLGTGTSTGVPSIACECETCISDDPRDKRLRVSVLIEHAGQTVIVDTSDRKSTRLNSSHLVISYAVFCLKKKTLAFPGPTCLECCTGGTASTPRSRGRRTPPGLSPASDERCHSTLCVTGTSASGSRRIRP